MTHCTYDQSTRLKEIWFDMPTRDFFLGDELFYGLPFDCKNWNQYKENTSAPTHAEALQWFREKKGLHGWVEPFVKHLFNRWTYCITIKNVGLTALGSAIYPTHPEAESALIDKLITILEKQKT